MADTFLGGPKPPHVHECTRKKGDILRFDPSTQACGVLGKDRVIRTYFKPVPCVSIPWPQRAAAMATGRCHGEADNLKYFQRECLRW